MALKIKWSNEAEKTYLDILLYLEENWGAKEISNFINRTETLLRNISHQPYIFKASKGHRIRKAAVTKQNSLFYRINKSHIYLITFWDNRQDPKKSKY